MKYLGNIAWHVCTFQKETAKCELKGERKIPASYILFSGCNTFIPEQRNEHK